MQSRKVINKCSKYARTGTRTQKPQKEENEWKLDSAPIPAEWCRAVAPKSLGIAGLAPPSRRYLAVSVCPCRAAWIRGVSPVDKLQKSID